MSKKKAALARSPRRCVSPQPDLRIICRCVVAVPLPAERRLLLELIGSTGASVAAFERGARRRGIVYFEISKQIVAIKDGRLFAGRTGGRARIGPH
jgi:hypothetical protein